MLRGQYDDMALLPKEEEGDGCYYQPVVACKRKRIMVCLSMDSFYWAVYKLFNEVILVFTFGSAATLGNTPFGNFSILGAYVLFAFVVAPLWQCFSVQQVASSKDVGCEHGCMAGMACLHVGGICACRNLLVLRGDKRGAGPDWWAESVEGGGGGLHSPPFSRSNTGTSVNSAGGAVAASTPPSITRYIPFSIYNLVYIIANNGRQELNAELPFDQMGSFGMGRAMLLCFGTSIRASLSLALVYNAYYALQMQGELVFTVVSLVALVSALMDLDVYLVGVFFGTALYPYSLVVWLALYFPMFDWVLNPKQGTFLFWMMQKYWETVVSCINVDVKSRGGDDYEVRASSS